MKKWKIFSSEDCPNCGCELEVLSEIPEEDGETESFFIDGEEVRCVAECGFKSTVNCDGENAWINDGNIDELQEELNRDIEN